MSGQCTYYASPAWRARVEASVKEWSMHMFLRFRNEAGVNQVRTNRGRTETLERLAARLDTQPERLRWTPVWELWTDHDAETLGFEWTDVVDAWRAVNALPDAGTDDLADACPHAAVEDDRCLFHLPPAAKDDEEVRDALVEAIQSGDPSKRALDGARFGSLDLSATDLGSEGTNPIDLRFAVVEGELDMSNTTVPDSMFSMRFATVRGDATFRGARFGGTATFVGAEFSRNVSFYRTRFESKARFTRTRFGTTAGASESDQDGGEATGRRYATFAKGVFERSGNFHGARFDARANFDEARVDGLATFVDTVFADGVHLVAATLARARWRTPSAETPIDMSRARFDRGVICLGDRPVRFDFERATLGRVDLAGDDTAYNRLDRLRFHETEFDGFIGPNNRDAFEAVSWRIHDYASESGPWTRFGRRLGPWGSDTGDRNEIAEIERTYLRAKQGADAAGDTTAAGEFFRRERAYRRLGHGYRFRALPRWSGWVGLSRWLANLTMAVTTGYGERPSRVVLSSVAVCGLFALAYAGGGVPAGDAVQFRQYLLFSLQSFISFIVDAPPIPGTESFGLRVASAFEGFLGAFFIALFVFTLTRSIHR